MISYKAKKHLGQNFLTDQRTQLKIIQSCDLQSSDTVLEIGPGQGALTNLIAPVVGKLICVETDHDLIEPLKGTVPFLGTAHEIIHANFLKWDMALLPEGIKVIGNIPYNISTPIIEKLIEQREKISSAFLTVQLEFGQRLAANPGGKEYGSLSCFAQYYLDIKLLFKIKNTCFRPAPKVDSCFLRLIPRPPIKKAHDEVFLFKMIQTAFQQRRKTIVNALKPITEKDILEKALASLKIDFNKRPEVLTLSNYVDLANLLVL